MIAHSSKHDRHPTSQAGSCKITDSERLAVLIVPSLFRKSYKSRKIPILVSLLYASMATAQPAPAVNRPVQDMDQIRSGTEGQDNAVGALIANGRCDDARRLAAFYSRRSLMKSVERACGAEAKGEGR